MTGTKPKKFYSALNSKKAKNKLENTVKQKRKNIELICMGLTLEWSLKNKTEYIPIHGNNLYEDILHTKLLPKQASVLDDSIL